jgi:hypothetical protein
MRHCLIFCAALTAACDRPATLAPPYIPADLLTPCTTPAMPAETEREFARKVLRIAADRDCANAKIEAVATILQGPQ